MNSRPFTEYAETAGRLAEGVQRMMDCRVRLAFYPSESPGVAVVREVVDVVEATLGQLRVEAEARARLESAHADLLERVERLERAQGPRAVAASTRRAG